MKGQNHMGAMYEKICSWENLLIAHRKASSGKRGKSAAAVFEYKLADNLLALQHDLENKLADDPKSVIPACF
jgi:hypothetical protein